MQKISLKSRTRDKPAELNLQHKTKQKKR